MRTREQNPKKNPEARRKRPSIKMTSQDGMLQWRSDDSVVTRVPYLEPEYTKFIKMMRTQFRRAFGVEY